ncbi:30S ribosomal protein S2 [Candidatus Peregrinibacteria bacterium]|nr:30S ribosomal protein S2 [Candidatus Peregrinibacteria bacterium]MBI3816683.1 30S ribosomal protein S2 [Candidatus Peregrinibacteria bacterium]
MPIPSEKELLENAVHFGHRKEKWNPKMTSYLYGVRKGIHIFDLAQTKKHLEDVCAALKKLQIEGKTILFVSTKQQSIPVIERLATSLNQPMVTKKWIAGLLTNWTTIKRRLKYYLDLQRSFQTGEVEKYTKKEQTELRKKLAKLDIALAGVSKMTGLPDAVFVVDAVRDRVAVLEAAKLKIPLYGICDSNADPDTFTTFIPANDDAVKSITIILATIGAELREGKAHAEKHESEMLPSSIA